MDPTRRRAFVAAAGTIGLLPLTGLRADHYDPRDPRSDSPDSRRSDLEASLQKSLREPTGASHLGFSQDAPDASARTALAKLRECVSVMDFGADPTGALDSTHAIHRTMAYLMDRFDGDANFYPPGPGDPTPKGVKDFTGRDRRTGRIYFPAGLYKVQPNVFSSLDHPRAPYVAFEFMGEHCYSSSLLLKTGGSESWFYDSSGGNERYQNLTFRSLGFTTDDYRHGNFAKVYSTGVSKQFTVELCEFRNLNKYMHTLGNGNADLMRTVWSWVEHYGDLLTLDNDQSVQHDFIGTHFRSWGSQVRVKRHGGGNVSIKNAFIDFLWDERVSPTEGKFLFVNEVDASIGNGNCTYKWEDCRVEVEAYKSTKGAPPFGLVKMPESKNAFPRVVFDNVNFVNGQTYAINDGGTIIGSDFRRIEAVAIHTGKFVEFRNAILLKNFFYTVAGDRDTNSTNAGGILEFSECYDGILDELPLSDHTLENLHSRVSYRGSAGRVITEGMLDHTTGSSFIRKLLDADPRWMSAFGREPASTKKMCHFKHPDNGLPSGKKAINDHYLDLPPGLMALRIYVKKAASGSDDASYQLHLKTRDRLGDILGSSTFAQFKTEHMIDLDHVDLTGVTRICLCASGDWDDFQGGGIAYIEYV